MHKLSEEQTWMLASAGSAAVAALVTRVAARQGWKAATGSRPPRNPAAAGTTWKQAMLWAVTTGMVVGVARVLTERATARTWHRMTGHLPRPLRW